VEKWQLDLAHDRAKRDAFVACGNPAPSRPDPPSGLIEVKATRYVARIFWGVMEAAGHDHSEMQSCKCSQGLRT